MMQICFLHFLLQVFQYFFEDMSSCLDFQVMYFDNMIRQIDQHFRGKFVFFDTVLEEIG